MPLTSSAPARLWPGLAAAALGWVVYLPVGAKYAAWLSAVAVCCAVLRARRDGAAYWRQPGAAAAVLLVAWIALSSLWSPAPAAMVASHIGLYALLLGLPAVGAALPAPLAAAALRHFCVASGLIALLFMLEHAGALPPSLLWHSTVDVDGNQRIANSMMLALGAALSLWQATRATGTRSRLAWAALAVWILLGLSLQDRRTGLVVLPFALLAWALAAQAGWGRRLAVVLGVVVGTGLVWQASDNVRARFAEGLAELRQYESADTVANSWGQRLRMAEVTAAMVREQPLRGHGVGSWQPLFQQRTTSGTMLSGHVTPHNEFLLLAQQAGIPAVGLLLWLVAAAVRSALRAGAAGMPSLMLWTVFSCAALFNVVLRDAKFALPLLLLAACCAAAQRGNQRAGRGTVVSTSAPDTPHAGPPARPTADTGAAAPAGEPPAAAAAPQRRYEALDALRGVAVLMVVYDHLFAVAGERMAGGAFAPTAWVREWISGPLGIIQDFGWLGVCLFFLISGFVIAHSARRETVRIFVLRRVFRILPPLAAAVLLVAALDLAAGVQRPWSDYLYGMTLAGYFTVPQVIVLGVAWTLVIEVLFYILMALVSPLLKGDTPAFGIALASAMPLLAILFARDLGASFFLFAASMAYLPVLLIGSTFYLRQATTTGPWTVALLLLANAAVFMLGLRSIHTAFLPIDNSYLVSVVYAVAIFLPCLNRRAPRGLKFVGDISYSLYLLHGTVGFFVIQHAVAAGAGPAAPYLAVAAGLGVSYLFHRSVERPAMALGKRLSTEARASKAASHGVGASEAVGLSPARQSGKQAPSAIPKEPSQDGSTGIPAVNTSCSLRSFRATPTSERTWTALGWCVAATAVVLLGAWLRLDQFVAQTLLDDEWHAVHQVVRSRPGVFLLSHGHADYSIALTLLYWALAQTVGLSELGMRMPSMLAGLATLVVLPLALGGRLRASVLVIFAMLLALSPLLVGYSRMARPYGLTLLLTLTAFAVIARAVAGGRVRWPLVAVYALLAALAVWLHAVTAPFVLAPLVALAMATVRGRGLSWRSVLMVSAPVLTMVALAVLPPLINDAASLAAKAGRDLPRASTLLGVWYVWLGTSSTAVVLVSLLLAALGAGPVWRSGPVVRWALLGLGLTLAAVLVVRPVWVFNPLTFGRYLLPALPLLLLCVAAGLVRASDWMLARAGLASGALLRHAMPLGMATVLATAGWFTSPHPALLREPNTNTLHYYFQFDFRPNMNPVVASFDAIPLSSFWSALRSQPPGSVTVAVAPFRFDSHSWLGTAWERASGQRVMPAFLSGACGRWFFGEVPADARFSFRNGVHLSDPAALAVKHVDYVAFDRRAKVTDDQGAERKAPECEAWMQQRFGAPMFEDRDLVVWHLGAARP